MIVLLRLASLVAKFCLFRLSCLSNYPGPVPSGFLTVWMSLRQKDLFSIRANFSPTCLGIGFQPTDSFKDMHIQ